MSRFHWSVLVLFLLSSVATTSDLFAQLRGSPAQPEPSRGRTGILGAFREARDERFNRANPPPTPPAKPNVSSQSNKPNTAQNKIVSGSRIATQQPSASQQPSGTQQAGTTQQLSRNNGQQPSLLNPSRLLPFGGTNPGLNSPSASRTQNDSPAMVQQNPSRILEANSVNPSNLKPSLNTSPVVAASALVPNRLPYTGPGIVIRLPADLNAEVNYLVDDVEQIQIRSGEENRLKLKGQYNVRFSRGVTDDKRSLGEARYSLIEGHYVFAITEKGWDLLREPIAPNPFEAANTLEPRPVEIEKRQPALVPDEPAASETLPAPAPEPSRS